MANKLYRVMVDDPEDTSQRICVGRVTVNPSTKEVLSYYHETGHQMETSLLDLVRKAANGLNLDYEEVEES